jgi:nicotinate-nucleotide pyrophosphorylase (carboxylating)
MVLALRCGQINLTPKLFLLHLVLPIHYADKKFMTDNILARIKPIIQNALAEDIAGGDVTTDCIVSPESTLTGQFVAKADGIVAGLAVAQLTFALLDERVSFVSFCSDSGYANKKTVIAAVNGPGRALLSGERVALNLLQRMSGIATLTRQFVEAVSPTKAVILDTRKTVPGLRLLDKWAVQLGGGQNHRFGLYDMVLIKDNHISAAGSITEAVNRVRAGDGQHRPIEVEVKNLDELRETLKLAVDRILLDNMSPAQMREAVQITQGRTPLEASGNVTLSNVADIAATGVDFISVGALTHSVHAMDISLLLK